MEQNSLRVATVPPRAFVRVQGRGSFQVSPALKKFSTSAIRQGCRTFVVDLEQCVGMDSTFMGVLAGIALRLRKQEKSGDVWLVNLDSKNISLLETLGLSNVVHMVKSPLSDEQRCRLGLPPVDSRDMDRLETGGESRDSATRTMLAAHQDLICVDPHNQPRFKNVVAFLQEDMRRAGTEPDDDGED